MEAANISSCDPGDGPPEAVAKSNDDGAFEAFKDGCWKSLSAAYQKGGLSHLARELEGQSETGQEHVESSNRIVVGVRTRPFNDREIRLGTQACVEHVAEADITVHKHTESGTHELNFAFDHTFKEDSSQDAARLLTHAPHSLRPPVLLLCDRIVPRSSHCH